MIAAFPAEMRKLLPLLLLLSGCSHQAALVTSDILKNLINGGNPLLFPSPQPLPRIPFCSELHDPGDQCLNARGTLQKRASERELTSIDRRPSI